MAAKEIKFGDSARKRMVNAVNVLAERSTSHLWGPKAVTLVLGKVITAHL